MRFVKRLPELRNIAAYDIGKKMKNKNKRIYIYITYNFNITNKNQDPNYLTLKLSARQ